MSNIKTINTCPFNVYITGGGHDNGYGAPQEKHMLEEENDRMVDALSSKVQALKSVSFFIKACSNKANIMQHCWANNVARCWTKILSKFKLKPISSNIVFKRI